MSYQGRDRQRYEGFSAWVVRGVSNACEGSNILTLLCRPTGVQLAARSPKLVEVVFCELPLYGVL